MILLILFYVAMVIAAGLLIAFGFSFYLRSRELSSSETPRINLYPPDPETYRPLFAPSEEEIRASERALQEKRQEAQKEDARAAAQRLLAEKTAAAEEFQTGWIDAPDRRKTAELLRLAAESGRAETFSEISKNVIQVWHDKKIAGLTAADLADLLDSHFRLLPQQEMASGALFWLKQEIAALRKEKN